jgi:oligosaccharide repeat unit polymerase
MNYLLIELLIMCLGVFFVRKNPKKHFLFLFSMILYFVYIFLGPLNSYNKDVYEKMGGNFYDYFDEGVLIYIYALLSFVFSYFIFFNFVNKNKNKKYNYVKSKFKFNDNSKYYLYAFFAIVTFVVFKKTSFEGESSVDSSYNYILFFADSLILGIVIFYYEKKLDPIILVIAIFSLLYFLILGFRYRIILLLIALMYNLLVSNKLQLKTIAKFAISIYLFSTIINFISINRGVFREQNFEEVELTTESPYEMSGYQFVMHQTDNYSTDFNVLKYMSKYNVDHDYGFSMFGHVLIRITPSSLYNNNNKPAIPQQEIIKNCFNSSEGLSSGAAVSNIFQYYIAFGIFGVVFFMGLLGYILAYFSKKLDLDIIRNRVIIVFIAMVLFQEITRAYFPQIVTLFAYLFITFKLFYKKNKKKYGSYFN